MAGPAGIGDADLAWWSNDVYAAIESDSGETIQLTQNLTTSGEATWATILDADDYPELDELFFGRVKFDPVDQNMIHVIGYCKGASDYDCHHFKTTNLGLTWTHRLVREAFAALHGDYIVTHDISPVVTKAAGAATLLTTHNRTGDDINTINPWGVVQKGWTDDPGGAWLGINYDGTTINSSGSTNLSWFVHECGYNGLLSVGNRVVAQGWFTDYFGAGWTAWVAGGPGDCPLDSARVNLKLSFDHSANGKLAQSETWVFWNVPNVVFTFAFDIAKTNHNWLYVGFVDAIYKSEDGGYTWLPLIETEGAYDILVDPSIAGAIYYWSANLTDNAMPPTGSMVVPLDKTSSLRLMVAGVVVDTLENSLPSNAVYRIAKSPNTGKLWTTYQPLTGIWGLGMRYLGSWTVMLSGNGAAPIFRPLSFLKSTIDDEYAVGAGMGIKMYNGEKGIYVDGMNLYITEDGWSTSADKKGDWASFGYGIVGHRMTTT